MNGTLDTSDVLLNRGLNGWYGAGSYHTREAYDGTVDNANIIANRALGTVETQRIVENQQAEADRSRDAYRQGFDILVAQQNQAQINSVKDTTIDRFASIERQMSANALAAQECCCENKAAIAEVKALVECNQKVNEAYRDGVQAGKIDLIVAQTSPN